MRKRKALLIASVLSLIGGGVIWSIPDLRLIKFNNEVSDTFRREIEEPQGWTVPLPQRKTASESIIIGRDREGLTAPDELVAVDEALARLRAANVAFNVPEHARVSTPLTIEAKLSTHLNQEELKKLVSEAGKLEASSLKASGRMIATLSGAAFKIAPSGPQEQLVSDKEVTSWTWQATPDQPGIQTLILNFDAIITINEKDSKRTISTLKKTISVDVGPPNSILAWLELINKYGESISWLWATLLIPIGGAIWAWVKRRKSVEHDKDTLNK